MDNNEVRFLKGNMGGNQVVLLEGDKIPEGEELEVALTVLEPPNVGGHQAGVLYRGKKENEIIARIVTITGRTYISMCGGLTQVLGKALGVKSFLTDLPLEISEPETELALRTDSGTVDIDVRVGESEVKETWTGMDSFVRECYDLGVEPIAAAGVSAYRVGETLCVEAEDIYEVYPDVHLEEMENPTLKILRNIQEDFLNQFFPDSSGKTFSVYDRNPDRSGDVRVIFPHQVATGHIEPACGTGTTAVGITMVEKSQLVDDGSTRLVAESGGSTLSIGGEESTTLDVEIDHGRIQRARFTHHPIEINAAGTVFI